MQNNVKKLLVYGGSFDPPHIGHMNLLRSAIDMVEPDETLVIPSGTAPHKQQSETAGALRLAMCRCFLRLGANVHISSMELERSGKSYTSDTIDELGTIYKNAVIYLCVGSDMLLSFTQWHKWRHLLSKVVLVVCNRWAGNIHSKLFIPTEGGDKTTSFALGNACCGYLHGADIEPELQNAARQLQNAGGRLVFTHNKVVQMASSDIRGLAAAGGDISELVPKDALEVIKQNGLYA